MVRDMEQSDISSLEAIHEGSGLDYRFPDVLKDPVFLVKKVVEEDGKVTQGMALELTASIYLWIDPNSGTKLHRLLRLKELVAEVKQEAWCRGLNSLYAVLPPEIEEEFADTLKFLGMEKDRQWPKWSIDLT